jgi:hypothetical protein
MSMLFVELRTCCAFLALGDCGLFHSDDCATATWCCVDTGLCKLEINLLNK